MEQKEGGCTHGRTVMDDKLDRLSGTAHEMKHVALALGTELDNQDGVLTDLEAGYADVLLRMGFRARPLR